MIALGNRTQGVAQSFPEPETPPPSDFSEDDGV